MNRSRHPLHRNVVGFYMGTHGLFSRQRCSHAFKYKKRLPPIHTP